MTFYVLTLFPKQFQALISDSILKRAVTNKIINVVPIYIRDFAKDKHKTVDDKPYGGGSGMILKVDLVDRALASIKVESHKILLSASGKLFDQKKASQLGKKKNITLICGHYEGTDARIEQITDESLSMGNYILTGGEIGAMAIIDALTRLLPGAISKKSLQHESFHRENYLEYPQYTRPETYKNMKVPPVLLSGDHKKIDQWRKKESIKRTNKYRVKSY